MTDNTELEKVLAIAKTGGFDFGRCYNCGRKVYMYKFIEHVGNCK